MITIYTDGACSGNPGIGGWGVVILEENKEEILNSFRQRITNNINLEFEEAKKQVKKIASFRLSEIIK